MKTVSIQRANHATTRQWRSFLWWRRVSVALGVVTWILQLALLPLLGDNPFAGLADDLYVGTGDRKSSRDQSPPFRSPALLVLPRFARLATRPRGPSPSQASSANSGSSSL